MRTLICLRGVSGSGKTAFAKLLQEIAGDARVECASADDFFINSDGEYIFNPAELKEAHNLCQGRVEWMMGGWTEVIVVHNTSTTEKEIRPYQELADKYGYRFVSLVVENLHGKHGVHNVPEAVVSRQRARLRGSISL